MSEQRPRKPLGSYLRKPSNGQAEQRPRKPIGSYLRQPGKELDPVQSIPYGSIILGLDTDTRQPVSVSQLDLCSGTYIVGVHGMGKSHLLEQVVYQQMQHDEAIIAIDPHGDLVNSIIAHMPAHRLSSTYLLDLTDRKYPFGLNAFVCSDPTDEVKRDETRNQIMHAFAKLWPEIMEGQYVKKYLPHIVILLIENPQLTLTDVEHLLDDDTYRQQYTRKLKNSRTREFWQQYERLNDNQRNRETSPLRGRLDQLLTEPVLYAILKQTKKTVNIRELIEERAILLVKLPVNETAYAYTASFIGTFLMSMIYATTFSFADVPLAHRPGFTLIVDEFQNFATDEYAKLFEQGRKYKVKQFLAHQHRQQLERGGMGKTNLAATLTAQTKIAFQTPNPKDSHELASSFTGIADRRRPTDIYIHPLEKIGDYPHPLVKQFVLDVVDRLDKASGQKLATERKFYEVPKDRYYGRHFHTEWITKSRTYKVSPNFDFGAGEIQINPKKAESALNLLDRLIYESEEQGKIIDARKEEFIKAVTPFWKLESTKEEAKEKAIAAEGGKYSFAALTEEQRGQLIQEQEQKLAAEAAQRRSRFIKLLDTVLAILIHKPIANDADLSNSDIAGMLEDLEKRHAFVKVGSTAYALETRDTRLLQTPTTAEEAKQRLQQVQRQTRARYCIPRAEPDEREEEAIEEETAETPPDELQPEPELIQMDMQEPEPIEIAVVYEPELPLPEPPAHTEPEHPPPERIPESKDTMNMLYAQLRAKAIDPDTTILASLGEHYVLTIRQWMRLFAWKSYPKATQHFRQLRENGLIYHKDREGRGGSLVTGDWFFLLTKGANELVRRKQGAPVFKLEPNEAERAAGDTLFHTYLVNEVLIHLRLLERSHPDIVRIERIDHERSIRRNYLAALADSKLYPDGFLRLLVPTPNGLRRRFTFLELEHTTQKDSANWKTKCRKYLTLFDRADTLEKFFATRTPLVLVITMDTEYISHLLKWTEEVLAERGEKGRYYSNRFIIGGYDTGISDMSVEPLQFFCTPRFYSPFQKSPRPIIGS